MPPARTYPLRPSPNSSHGSVKSSKTNKGSSSSHGDGEDDRAKRAWLLGPSETAAQNRRLFFGTQSRLQKVKIDENTVTGKRQHSSPKDEVQSNRKKVRVVKKPAVPKPVNMEVVVENPLTKRRTRTAQRVAAEAPKVAKEAAALKEIQKKKRQTRKHIKKTQMFSQT